MEMNMDGNNIGLIEGMIGQFVRIDKQIHEKLSENSRKLVDP
jgi:hypothetical protein